MDMNDRLKDARLSRSELAKLVGVSVNSTYNWGSSPPHYVLTIIKQHKILFIHEQIKKWKDKL